MSIDEQLQSAIADGDRDSANFAVNRLRLQVVEAIKSHDDDRQREVEDALTAFLRHWRSLVSSKEMNESFMVGQVLALQGVLRAVRDSQPTSKEMAATNSKYAKELLLALYQYGALRAQDILELTNLPDYPRINNEYKHLECYGLVTRDRQGKGASYWLTVRGNLVAKKLDEEQRRSDTAYIQYKKPKLVKKKERLSMAE